MATLEEAAPASLATASDRTEQPGIPAPASSGREIARETSDGAAAGGANRLDGTPDSAPSTPRPVSATPPAAADPAEQLFEAMQDLSRLETAPAGARFCLEAAMRAVPCLAGLVHLSDSARRELVVVHAQGPRADALLGTHTPQADPLVARAAQAGKPTVVVYGAEPGAERASCQRHAFFDPWSVVLVPVVVGGQLLALLEMIDPTDGKPLEELPQDALAYLASCLGRFLSAARSRE
jgi:hypothetical protein